MITSVTDYSTGVYQVVDDVRGMYWVPLDAANQDYQAVLDWVANGGTITSG